MLGSLMAGVAMFSFGPAFLYRMDTNMLGGISLVSFSFGLWQWCQTR